MSARQEREEGPNCLSSQADVVGGRPVGGGRAERSPHWTLAVLAAHRLGPEGGSEQVCVWCVRPWQSPRACPDSCSPTSPYCPRQAGRPLPRRSWAAVPCRTTGSHTEAVCVPNLEKDPSAKPLCGLRSTCRPSRTPPPLRPHGVVVKQLSKQCGPHLCEGQVRDVLHMDSLSGWQVRSPHWNVRGSEKSFRQ